MRTELYSMLCGDLNGKEIHCKTVCLPVLWLLIYSSPSRLGASQVALVINNLPVNEGDIDSGLIPGLGGFPGGGHGNPLQYSCLENSMDREAW